MARQEAILHLQVPQVDTLLRQADSSLQEMRQADEKRHASNAKKIE